MKFTMTLHMEAVEERLQKLPEMQHDLMELLAGILRQQTQQRFSTKRDPEGKA